MLASDLFSSRYPNLSCELLTSDVSQINDRLGEDESLLKRLYSFLLNDSPLNPLLASFFSKVLSILISRKPEQVCVKSYPSCPFTMVLHCLALCFKSMARKNDGCDLMEKLWLWSPFLCIIFILTIFVWFMIYMWFTCEPFFFTLQIVAFLKKKDDFVDLIIKHIGTSAIMDLLLRLLTCIEPPQLRQDVLNVSFGYFCPLANTNAYVLMQGICTNNGPIIGCRVLLPFFVRELLIGGGGSEILTGGTFSQKWGREGTCQTGTH